MVIQPLSTLRQLARVIAESEQDGHTMNRWNPTVDETVGEH